MNELALVNQPSLCDFKISPTPGLASQPAVQAGVGGCLHCGKPTPLKQKQRKNGLKVRKFCSRKCHQNYYAHKYAHPKSRQKTKDRLALMAADFRCTICGGSWPKNRRFWGGVRHYTCSDYCFEIRRVSNRKVWKKKKYRNDYGYKVGCVLRSRICRALKSKGARKAYSTEKYVGCSVHFLKKHIELKFLNGMTWDNHGTAWELDHIIPCSAFDLSKHECQLMCFSFSNLQPLWKSDNRKKGNRLDWKPSRL